MGAVAPSGKLLARTMAGYVDRDAEGPVIELGPAPGRSPKPWSSRASIPRAWSWSNSIRISAAAAHALSATRQ